MTQRYDEDGMKKAMISWLEEEGWDSVLQEKGHGSTVLNEKYNRKPEQVIYWELLKEKIVELNEDINEDEAGEIIKNLERDISSENLVNGNKEFYKILRNGYNYTKNDENRSLYVDLIDTDNLENNSFIAVDEFQVSRRNQVRPDISLVVNGVPLVHIELKMSAQEKDQDATVKQAIKEMKDYESKEEGEPRMFVPSLFNAVSDGEKFRYAAVGAPKEFYFPWKSENDEEYEPKDAAKDLLKPKTLMDIFEHFVFYSEDGKIIPRYMQYQAANRIVERIQKGEPRKGLVWHTQGSGKSFTMLFTAYKAKKLGLDQQYLLIVDRKKLEEQMSEDLNSINFPLFEVAESTKDLERLLKEGKTQLILTIIDKFNDLDTDNLTVETTAETVILMDEAHRATEGKLGSKLKAATPNRFYFGFTGTPVNEGKSQKDRNTFNEFSPEGEDYLHRYSIKQGQDDNVITRVSFTLSEIEWDIPEEELDRDFDKEFSNLDLNEKRQVLTKYVNQTELTELRPRIEKVTENIRKHYSQKVEPNGFKGLVVTPSKKTAALYSDEIRKYWNENEVDAVISKDEKRDDKVVKKYYKNEDEERKLIKKFKKEENPKLLVVCSKLLTGFDAPILKTLYLDKSLKNHNLLQAIARTNRPMSGKSNGEIVDYQGVFVNPEEALEYDYEIEAFAQNTEKLIEDFKDLLNELIEFLDVDLENNPEEFYTAITFLRKNPEKASRFANKYTEAEGLYESVSPHEELGKKEIEAKWDALSQIYYRYMELEDNTEDESIGENAREKTRKILEKHIDLGEINNKEIEYEIKEQDVAQVEDFEPDYPVATKGPQVERDLQPKVDKNPAYPRLSKRVKEVIEKWRNDGYSEPGKAMEALEKIETEAEELEEERKELELNEPEFAILKLVEQNYSSHFSSQNEMVELVKKIGDKTRNKNLSGNISQIRDDLRGEIIRVLASEGKIELAKEDNRSFLTQSVNYILENR